MLCFHRCVSVHRGGVPTVLWFQALVLSPVLSNVCPRSCPGYGWRVPYLGRRTGVPPTRQEKDRVTLSLDRTRTGVPPVPTRHDHDSGTPTSLLPLPSPCLPPFPLPLPLDRTRTGVPLPQTAPGLGFFLPPPLR